MNKKRCNRSTDRDYYLMDENSMVEKGEVKTETRRPKVSDNGAERVTESDRERNREIQSETLRHLRKERQRQYTGIKSNTDAITYTHAHTDRERPTETTHCNTLAADISWAATCSRKVLTLMPRKRSLPYCER